MTKKNRIIITSPNFYLPNIEAIEVISSSGKVIIYNSTNFILSNNKDKLILTLNVNENEHYTLTKIKSNQYSNKETNIKIINKEIILNENVPFIVNNFIAGKFSDNNELSISIIFQSYISNMENYITFNGQIAENCEFDSDSDPEE